jgi:hypothetical protein
VNFTKLLLAFVGLLVLTSAASATTWPSGINYAVNFTVFNAQTTGTAVNFTENITVNSSLYTALLNANLSNAEWFNDSGSIMPSWLEVGNSTYNNTLYWVKFPYAIPANTNVTVYLGIGALNSNYFAANGSTGESPTLPVLIDGGAYGQYDNGNSTFLAYFNGNTGV